MATAGAALGTSKGGGFDGVFAGDVGFAFGETGVTPRGDTLEPLDGNAPPTVCGKVRAA